MSLLILFPRRAYRITMMVASSGSGGGTDLADDYQRSYVKKPQVLKKRKKAKKIAFNLPEPIVEVQIEKVPEKESLPAKEVKVQWKQLLKPKALKKIEEILTDLGKIKPKHIDFIFKRKKKTLKLIKIKPKKKLVLKKVSLPVPAPKKILKLRRVIKPVLEFSDDELITAVHLIQNKIRPQKPEFTDDEILMAIYLYMENKK